MAQRSIILRPDMEGIVPPVRAGLDTDKGYNKPKKSDSPIDPYLLKVIHVPTTNPRTDEDHRITVPLVRSDSNNKDYNDLERQLKSIPNIRDWKGTTNFTWTQRSLIRLPATELGIGGPSMSYEFLMYICLDPTSNLPRNTYLERLGEYSKVPVDDKVPVYGDAFIFMMKPWPEESDHPKGAAYVHMTDQFAAGARAHISEKIPKLLRSLPKPEKNEEQ